MQGIVCIFLHNYRRPHKRGLEQNCLPLALTSAIIPAVALAQIIEDKKDCALRPAAQKKKKERREVQSNLGEDFLHEN